MTLDWPHPLIGGDAALDFVDTELRDEHGEPLDRLASYVDLIAIMDATELLDEAAAKAAVARFAAHRGAEKTLSQAKDLRAAIRSAAERIADGKPIGRGPLEAINPLLRHRIGYHELRPARADERGALGERYIVTIDAPSDVLVPLASAARDLLVFKDPTLIKRCANREACTHVFYDTSKNHTRRWCSMSGCGNLAKASAFRARRRGR